MVRNEYYLLDGAVTLGVFSPNGSLDWNIITPWGEVIGRRTSTNQWRYYAKDHLGSTRAVVTSTGSIVEVRDYYPYGLHMPGRSMVSGTAAKEGFTGHELDAESGLIYAGARYYIPGIGRWMAVDPLADKYPGWSPYNYVLNNPLGYTDPDGRSPKVVAIPWLLRGAVTIARNAFVRAAPSAGATVITTKAAIDIAEGLREGMSRVDVGTGAPPISGTDIGERAMVAPDATGVAMPHMISSEGLSSKYEDITEPGSIANRETDVTRGEFEANLREQGFSETTSKDGQARVYEKDGTRYSTRDRSKTDGRPTADHFSPGQKRPDLKIRLKPDN